MKKLRYIFIGGFAIIVVGMLTMIVPQHVNAYQNHMTSTVQSEQPNAITITQTTQTCDYGHKNCDINHHDESKTQTCEYGHENCYKDHHSEQTHHQNRHHSRHH